MSCGRRNSSRPQSVPSNASTNSIPKASPTSTNGSRNIRRCGLTPSTPWDATSTAGPAGVRRARGRSDDPERFSKRPAASLHRSLEYATRRITPRIARRKDWSASIPHLAVGHAYIRWRLRDPHLRTTHTASRRARVGGDHGTRTPGALVPDKGPHRSARRRKHRLPDGTRPGPRDGEDPHLGAAARVRARVEHRPAKGPPDWGEDHRSLGAHPPRRRHPPPFHPPASHPPDCDRLCRRYAWFPRPPRESTRRCAARGLGHSDQRSAHELSAVGNVSTTDLRLYEWFQIPPVGSL